MIIPVRVPAAAVPTTAGGRQFTMRPDHPLYRMQCPVCEERCGAAACVLVLAGVRPENRKPAGWVNGAAVIVHAACAGVPEEEEEAS